MQILLEYEFNPSPISTNKAITPEEVTPMQILLEYEFNPSPRYGHGKSAHAALYRIVEHKRAAFERYVRVFASFQEDFAAIPLEESREAPERPYWNNGFFPALDAISLHGLLCLQRPRMFCEIGSGHSTRFARHAIQRHRLSTQVISIDPHPRADIDALCDVVIRQPVEDVAPEYFDRLEGGDVLFMDSSHHAFTNSDVTAFYLDILPRLKPGVWIHIHDVFLPYDYPPEWRDGFYNEQYLLACVLLARNPSYDIELANTFMMSDPQLHAQVCQLFEQLAMTDMAQYGWATRSSWSFWMRKL